MPLFSYLQRNPGVLHESIDPGHFAKDLLRPVVGMVGYIVAALLGVYSTRSSRSRSSWSS